MKKGKILYLFAVLVIAALAGWNVNLNSQTKGMSDVMLKNMEALAGGEELEVVIECDADCWGRGQCWYDWRKGWEKYIYSPDCFFSGWMSDSCPYCGYY